MTLKITALAAAAVLSGCAMNGQDTAPRDSFFSTSIQNVFRGDGDVLFVNAAGRWYRTELNEGCMDSVLNKNPQYQFLNRGSTKVDAFTRVKVKDGGGNLLIECQVRSVLQTAAPPMVDSSSTVATS